MKQLRKIIIRFLHYTGLYKYVRWCVKRSITAMWRFYGFVTWREKRALNKYLRKFGVRKLHLGSGLNDIDGWLNTDLIPNHKRIKVDVSKRFPFSDNTFDYVFSEHMIEHLPYNTGKNMIAQSFRVLKPGGIIRIATPDLRFLINLYEDEDKKIHKDYIEWNAGLFIGDKAPHDAISVFNNYVRDWGHQYIYDARALTRLLEQEGFFNIKPVEIGKSAHAELLGLENEKRHPEGFLALESMVFEAEKPL